METPTAKEELIRQLKTRMGEVAEHRAERWLGELNKITGQSAKKRLANRMDHVPKDLAVKWLKELDDRLDWLVYRKDHEEFCFGVSLGECEDCRPARVHLVCPNYEYCKAESEAEWPEKKT